MREPGVEPRRQPWEGRIIPLDHSRQFLLIFLGFIRLINLFASSP